MENSNWIIVGLDSAYESDVLTLYMNGSIGGNTGQIPFLQMLMNKRKKMVLLTHHNGLLEKDDSNELPLKLFSEITSAFAGQTPPAYWYWGHAHAGMAYKPLAAQGNMRCRCLGHAALPWGFSTDLRDNRKVEWFEQRNAGDPNCRLRVLNGFVVLQLDGAQLAETFYDENGGVAWRPAD